MATRCRTVKSHIVPTPDNAKNRSTSVGCHDILLSVMFRELTGGLFGNGATKRLIILGSTLESLGQCKS